MVAFTAYSASPPPVRKTRPPAVTMGPGAPLTPSRSGSSTPSSAGFSRTDGVSPMGTCHAISPTVRSYAVSVPYGGLCTGRPLSSLRDRRLRSMS